MRSLTPSPHAQTKTRITETKYLQWKLLKTATNGIALQCPFYRVSRSREFTLKLKIIFNHFDRSDVNNSTARIPCLCFIYIIKSWCFVWPLSHMYFKTISIGAWRCFDPVLGKLTNLHTVHLCKLMWLTAHNSWHTKFCTVCNDDIVVIVSFMVTNLIN